MGTGMAPYIAPTAFVTVAMVTALCAVLLAAEAAALLRRVARRTAAATPWWMRWLAVLSALSAVWSGGIAVAGYLAYRFFRDSPSYTATGYDVNRAIQAYQALARMEALALGTAGAMVVLLVLGFVALSAAPRGSTAA